MFLVLDLHSRTCWSGVAAAFFTWTCLRFCRVKDLNGKSYRLLQNNLDKDIVPGESKILVKRDKVIVKLQKV